jgi:prevent-host-death family protein
MDVATFDSEVGIRDLKNRLSHHLDQVRAGAEVIVTDRGRPIARLVPIDGPTDRLAALIDQGIVRAPKRRTRRRPAQRIVASGTVSDLVADQRR